MINLVKKLSTFYVVENKMHIFYVKYCALIEFPEWLASRYYSILPKWPLKMALFAKAFKRYYKSFGTASGQNGVEKWLFLEHIWEKYIIMSENTLGVQEILHGWKELSLDNIRIEWCLKVAFKGKKLTKYQIMSENTLRVTNNPKGW